MLCLWYILYILLDRQNLQVQVCGKSCKTDKTYKFRFVVSLGVAVAQSPVSPQSPGIQLPGGGDDRTVPVSASNVHYSLRLQTLDLRVCFSNNLSTRVYSFDESRDNKKLEQRSGPHIPFWVPPAWYNFRVPACHRPRPPTRIHVLKHKDL